jgi:trans-2,3-dihydro-3-hydroxyanthranilate isomerase
MTRKLRYHLVDVFTDRLFGGNQLAVFTNGRGVPASLMQQIARELNFSETTFVLPPQAANNDFWVRIFTPAAEVPIAGHPTVGTAFVLALEQFIDTSAPKVTVRFEEGVGIIPVTLQIKNGRPGLVKMGQPLPQFGPEFTDRALMAAMLSLDLAQIVPNLPLQVVSSGLPFLYVPLANLAAIRQVKLRLDLWEQHLAGFATSQIFVFTPETELENSAVHCRMFAPGLGVAEDPATGSASGPLGAYLVKYGLIKATADQPELVTFISEQGFEMGRPSLIQVEIEQDNGRIIGVAVGGHSVYVGEGVIEV